LAFHEQLLATTVSTPLIVKPDKSEEAREEKKKGKVAPREIDRNSSSYNRVMEIYNTQVLNSRKNAESSSNLTSDEIKSIIDTGYEAYTAKTIPGQESAHSPKDLGDLHAWSVMQGELFKHTTSTR